MLRLVHPAPTGQEKRTRKPRKRSYLIPPPEEQKRIRVAIRNTARAYGGLDVLASIIGAHPGSLSGPRTYSYAFAVLVARAAGIPVEQVLSGKPHEAGSCALCGRKGAR